jgi:hypothetical protein
LPGAYYAVLAASRGERRAEAERCRICTPSVAGSAHDSSHTGKDGGRIAVEAVPGAPWGWCALVMQGSWSCSGARVSCVRCCVYSCLTASVWLADAQAGGSPGEAQGARILRHRREGLRTHGSRGPVGPQGASTHLCPQKAVGQQRKPAEERPVVGAGEAEPRRPHDRQARAREKGSPLCCRLCVGCVLDPHWQLLCCFRDAAYIYTVLPVLRPPFCLACPPPRQHRCPRPATSTRARRLSTTLTTAGPPPRPRAAKLLPGLVCRACLSWMSAAPTLDSLVDTIQLLVPALPAHALSTGRGRRAGLHIPT